MSLAQISIKRPVFITAIVTLMLAMGLLSIKKLGVDLFPNVTFPVVFVSVPYPGAGPAEIETQISKVIEDDLSTLSGLKRLSSNSVEGVGVVIAEFTLETDVKYAEQQIRDRMNSIKRQLPRDALEPTIRRIDPSDQAIVTLSLQADLPAAELFDLADQVIRPKLEQVNQVGQVTILGGRRREIRVELDRRKLKARELSASMVASRLTAAGQDIPAGKVDGGDKEVVIRAKAQFESLDDIRKQVVNFIGSDVPTAVSDLGVVVDSLETEKTRAYVNGQPSLILSVFRQSGANTVAVVDAVFAKIKKLEPEFKTMKGSPKITVVRDGSRFIRFNLDDVQESILIGVLLTVIVVFFFLGSGRSTLITGLALPNSLIGAFILMAFFGFTINVMTLLALSLAVGLLVDDAIVVRENIFRHIEMGKSPARAALEGTSEVTLAVIATTLTVLAVFGPVAFLKGVVGQFFREFGLTICFAMAISLFDALTIAPMLSAYFAGKGHGAIGDGPWLYRKTLGALVRGFNSFQTWLEDRYEALLKIVVRRPAVSLLVTFLIFIGSFAALKFVPKTFLPTQEAGEFTMSIELNPGTTLDQMDAVAKKIDKLVRDHQEVDVVSYTLGSGDGDANRADFYVLLVPSKDRRGMSTSNFKELLREELKPFAYANPQVKDFDAVGAGQRPFTVNIVGFDQKKLEEYAKRALEITRANPGLKDVDWNYRTGKPEFQAVLIPGKADRLGVSTISMGSELRAQIEGIEAAKYRENGKEYNIRVRLQEDQRDLRKYFGQTYVPNINMQLVRLSDVSTPFETTGPAKISRQDRGRYIQIGADIAPGGGLGDIVAQLTNAFQTDLKLPPDMRFAFVGQAENFAELAEGMVIAVGLGILFIFLVLASLYESFVTPLTIMIALPLAVCGSFFALALTRESMNIFSMIGMIMLLGIATKNSILLVDYASQLVRGGTSRVDAIIQAGRTRLRPILMTTMALIAGTLPVALGLNEASKQRTSMGIAIIGGLISSTLLTLVVVPAVYQYFDRFREWSLKKVKRLFSVQDDIEEDEGQSIGNGTSKREGPAASH